MEPFTWHDFLDRMRQPSAAEFVKSIKSFIVSFSHKSPDADEDSGAVQQFLESMENSFRAHPLWAGCSEEQLESAGEGLEKYVMTKLFARVFGSFEDDVASDGNLSEKITLIQHFIRPHHLDIKPVFQNESSWLLAQKELQRMNMYKAPREKLACILNCCKVISNILLQASISSHLSPPGADDFLPILIYVTLKANPPQLHSNLVYIQRYRRQSRLSGEAAYYFTNMLSVDSFISNISAESLSMDESEFNSNMESSSFLLSRLSGDILENPDPGSHLPPPPATEPTAAPQVPVSASVVEEAGAASILRDDDPGRLFTDYPYLYARAGDLTVADVERLLCSYKKLVFRYVCLSRSLGAEGNGSEK